MAARLRLFCVAAWVLAAMPRVVTAQSLDYPTPGVAPPAHGEANLSAPAPRTDGGKPDLSGMWGWDTPAKCGARCNDFQLAREFMNIAAGRPGTLPYRPGVGDGGRKRAA